MSTFARPSKPPSAATIKKRSLASASSISPVTSSPSPPKPTPSSSDKNPRIVSAANAPNTTPSTPKARPTSSTTTVRYSSSPPSRSAPTSKPKAPAVAPKSSKPPIHSPLSKLARSTATLATPPSSPTRSRIQPTASTRVSTLKSPPPPPPSSSSLTKGSTTRSSLTNSGGATRQSTTQRSLKPLASSNTQQSLVTSLQLKISQLEKQLADQNLQNKEDESLREILKDKDAVIESLRIHSEFQQSQIQSFLAEKESLQTKIDAQRKVIEKQAEAVKAVSREMDSLRIGLKEREGEVERMKGELEGMKGKAVDDENNNDVQTQSEISDLSNVNYIKQIEEKDELIGSLQSKLSKSLEECKALQQQISTLQEGRKVDLKKIEKLHAELKVAQEEARDLVALLENTKVQFGAESLESGKLANTAVNRTE
ncbi:hypothetical protein HDV05_003273 [Chytridiales sp. JEL 0842]|nr:hypothetical protein HDV05_003273 [Chytridiales sp. JEL 0842]